MLKLIAAPSIAFVSLLTAFSAPAAAEGPVLVEVFSSHNCMACPKAHKNMAELEESRDDVLILTWSVDYWDYLGAPDPMATPEAKARQAAYVERFGLRGPYTPQTVFDGAAHCAGNKMARVERALDARTSEPRPSLAFMPGEDGAVTLSGEAGGPLEIHLIHIADLPESPMVNPVLAVEPLGAFDGAPVALSPECEGACVLIAQVPGHGPVKAAFALR